MADVPDPPPHAGDAIHPESVACDISRAYEYFEGSIITDKRFYVE
jgi:hypothetical protein